MNTRKNVIYIVVLVAVFIAILGFGYANLVDSDYFNDNYFASSYYPNYKPLTNTSQNPSLTAGQIWTKVGGSEKWLQKAIDDGDLSGGGSSYKKSILTTPVTITTAKTDIITTKDLSTLTTVPSWATHAIVKARVYIGIMDVGDYFYIKAGTSNIEIVRVDNAIDDNVLDNVQTVPISGNILSYNINSSPIGIISDLKFELLGFEGGLS